MMRLIVGCAVRDGDITRKLNIIYSVYYDIIMMCVNDVRAEFKFNSIVIRKYIIMIMISVFTLFTTISPVTRILYRHNV